MLIGGLQKTTLLDYPDKVAATVFTIGCNFRCSFCHNPDIVKGIAKVIATDEILNFLKKRRKLLDAVCITGGEPTIQSGLISFLKKLKNLGYLVKLDTNGTNPELLQKLIDKKLVDYVAMDIKAPWRKYAKVTCRKLDLSAIKKSVIILKKGKVDYEFRSTILPALHSPEDIESMARQIKGADRYYLQQFQVSDKLVSDDFVIERPYTKKQLNEIVQPLKEWFRVCRVR
ncbi:anaerobic ribonucleoside-triphosphate reductase activating protein [Candidatus Falkowbacteria bacterium]|jgi:pyruvate formate lyase activating enzyme|nr:anaerobic ribonucleoside-triphosphate reductase activating protein [Candidatus Falkowbacteria bacterium]MBT5503641.1 anaerobic ribonucleoside-triphosphate reductase activating protein [Candidatus Falkowbacteria bacterium]MBT6574105.1 anaerobic ribonucleoside-triphosphate reductase activating protein [Candidatus Falkowbacteria bacterium]MBT7500689.1 anaerobic ribonucleoside-triphosphate reductase activating protein [Candidatus Falkowbacteria bacterium]